MEDWEIETLQTRCTEMLNDGNPPVDAFPLDPRLESSVEKSKKSSCTSPVSPSQSMSCERER